MPLHGDTTEDALSRISNGLISYINIHFSNEENYFDRFGYTEAPEHKEVHAYFVQKVLGFMDGFEQGNLDASIDMMRFLSDWLTTHIKGNDRKYAPFLIAKGLE